MIPPLQFLLYFRNEFDIIPVLEPKNNKSPVVLVDHKLGLELWSVKILFQYAYHTLMSWRNKKSYKFIGKLCNRLPLL